MIPVLATPSIPAMSDEAIGRVREFEKAVMQREQMPIVTRHMIHAGMYARTIKIPAGVVITGALIKRATILIMNGCVHIATEGGEQVGGEQVFEGYNIIAASAHRKLAFFAHTDTYITAIFPTEASSVTDAESEMTDEVDLLVSRHSENIAQITGE